MEEGSYNYTLFLETVTFCCKNILQSNLVFMSLQKYK